MFDEPRFRIRVVPQRAASRSRWLLGHGRGCVLRNLAGIPGGGLLQRERILKLGGSHRRRQHDLFLSEPRLGRIGEVAGHRAQPPIRLAKKFVVGRRRCGRRCGGLLLSGCRESGRGFLPRRMRQDDRLFRLGVPLGRGVSERRPGNGRLTQGLHRLRLGVRLDRLRLSVGLNRHGKPLCGRRRRWHRRGGRDDRRPPGLRGQVGTHLGARRLARCRVVRRRGGRGRGSCCGCSGGGTGRGVRAPRTDQPAKQPCAQRCNSHHDRDLPPHEPESIQH